MPAPADDITSTTSSAFRVRDDDVARQLCRLALGAGLQARKHSSGDTTEVVIDHLEAEGVKVEQMVRGLDPQAKRTSTDNAG